MKIKNKISNVIVLALVGVSVITPILNTVNANELNNIEQNTKQVDSVKEQSIQPLLGGGPSPSAAWTVHSSKIKTLSKSQIIKLNDQAELAQKRGKLSQAGYNLSITIAGFMSHGIPYFAAYQSFQRNQGTLISNTLNTVRQSLVHMEKTKKTSVKVKFVTYYRPASGEKISVATGIVK